MDATVLIVDDHASFRSSARLLLELEGFEVVGEAEDGHTAVQQTAALAPDLVLLDVQLPDIDGFEVCTPAHPAASPRRPRPAEPPGPAASRAIEGIGRGPELCSCCLGR